jgi:hypothetical protein
VNEYLPSGTWYIIAEVNVDHVVTETEYGNNRIVSGNTMTVAPYTEQFLNPPTVSDITDHSFVVGYAMSGIIYETFYRYQFAGLPAPSVDDMKSSASINADTPLTVSNLSPAQEYDVYFMGDARDGNVSDILKVGVLTLGTAIPAMIASPSQIFLSPARVGDKSVSSFVDVYGFHLAAPLVIDASSGFALSSDDVNYTSQLILPISDFTNGAYHRVFIKSLAFDSPGNKTGTCTLTTTGTSNQTVALGVVIYNPSATNFEGISSIEESGWSTYSVTGPHTWSLVDLSKSSVSQRVESQNMAMQIDGSVGGKAVNEDWLISPSIDMSAFTLPPVLRFRAYGSGEGEPLVLMYSADYPGYGDPRSSTWFSATEPLTYSNSWNNVLVPILDQQEMHFAFIYKSTDQKGSRWTIDEWRITDNVINIPDNELVFENVSVGTSSAPQSLLVSVSGFGSVTIAASDEFQVSVDGVVYSPAVVVREEDITAGIQLNVRYLPKKFVQEREGTLTFTAGTSLSVVRNSLVGRPGLTTAVAERSSGTGFLYPNPTEGDVHFDFSSLPDMESTYPVFIANSIGAHVATFDAPAYTLDHTLSSIFTNLEPGVYFVTIKGLSTTLRTKLIRK